MEELCASQDQGLVLQFEVVPELQRLRGTIFRGTAGSFEAVDVYCALVLRHPYQILLVVKEKKKMWRGQIKKKK